MELSQLIKGGTVFLDTAPLIYFIEKHPVYHPLVKQVVAQFGTLATEGLTSTLTLLEVMVHPLKSGNTQLADMYTAILLHSNGLVTHEITHEISLRAASLRAEYGLKTPDAIQLATAMHHSAEFFLTNDLGLKKVAGVDIVLLDDFVHRE